MQTEIYNVLTALYPFCPSDKERKGLTELASGMLENKETTKEICRVIISRMYDGLTYGNWTINT